MISGDIDKFHNFQISFAFFRILKSFRCGFLIVFAKQDVGIFFNFMIRSQIWLNNINIIIPHIFFYYLN
jgi:hypothetical protein